MKKAAACFIMACIINCYSYSCFCQCNNSDFESGTFNGWNRTKGCAPNVINQPNTNYICNEAIGCCPNSYTAPNSNLVSGFQTNPVRFALVSGAGSDPCISAIPVVAPGGGNYSVRLGNLDNGNIFSGEKNANGEAEQISNTFSVTSSNALFTFMYAVIIEDPQHTIADQPYFEAAIFGPGGLTDTVPCSYYYVVAGQGTSVGFSQAALPCNQSLTSPYYKNWTNVSVDLSPYIGQSVTVRFTVADCAQGAHFCYAYIDCMCAPATPVAPVTVNTCQGTSTTLTAASGYVSYFWMPTGQTTQSISTSVAGSNTVTMTLAGGCTSQEIFNVTVDSIPQASFTINGGGCASSTVTFTNTSTSSSGNNITNWYWNFGDGNTSTLQNPPPHTYSQGSYTVTLIVTTSGGCMDTLKLPVNGFNNPIANFSDSLKGCAPVCASFNDLSNAVSGTIVSWQWGFQGGTPSSSIAQNPYVCYNTPGDYNVYLIITTNLGCKDTLSVNQYVHVYSTPNADFCVSPATASIDNPVFSFCNLWSSDVSQWFWNFGDGSPLDSLSLTPVHSYSSTVTGNEDYSYNVCINVENQYGCWDTACRRIEILPEFTFYIPNSFTPNGDWNNEFFFGKGRGIKDYNIWLFDRWGNMIWDCHYSGNNTQWDSSPADGMPSACKWDGKVAKGKADLNGHSGELAQEDVYVWKVNLTDISNKQHNYVGHVSAVK
ncbi:MAG: PKD domain-containing protein [Bacteroidetes bacterium]|nr:PKD domain-containing protein [Bacteroidota bacterium]